MSVRLRAIERKTTAGQRRGRQSPAWAGGRRDGRLCAFDSRSVTAKDERVEEVEIVEDVHLPRRLEVEDHALRVTVDVVERLRALRAGGVLDVNAVGAGACHSRKGRRES